MMKYCVAFLCLWAALLSCHSRKELSREQEAEALETEMISFFRETLEKNYGSKDAIGLMVKGMQLFDYHYLLEVDRKRLREINGRLYGDGGLFSYFWNGRALDDSCHIRLFVPKGMAVEDFYRTEKYREGNERAERIREKGGYAVVTVVRDSAQYVAAKAKIENKTLPFKQRTADGFSYWERELTRTTHPALQKLRKMEEAIGEPSFPLTWGMLFSNSKNICADFATDREVQLYLTLYFWNFLCHFGNVDFHTGKDRTEVAMEALRREQEYVILGAPN